MTPAKQIDIEKEFETIRDLMDAYNKAQVDMFNEEKDIMEDLATLISKAIRKLDSLEERIGAIEDDVKALALEIDNLESTIKIATSGR